ncbi:MAG TPA: CRISPR-associated endonuclease Cas3'' [Thermoanaerobaculia bacterium]|nr:CRISPR-associated endonuclease Cas3'' [Thermoanaerobaculia bacterium]
MKRHYAHTLPGAAPEAGWQPLEEHLRNVGELAARFASAFAAAEWGRYAGLWHDLGKYSEAFQSYLRIASSEDPHVAETVGRIDHSTAGAQHAASAVEVLGHLLAYAISGHHGGLPDGRSGGPCLERRLEKHIEDWGDAPSSLTTCPGLEPPSALLHALRTGNAFSIAFFTRMVFSCLVDADFLDTERFMAPAKATARGEWQRDALARMEDALDSHIASLEVAPTEVNANREKVRDACLAAATIEPGLFSLTVPTGGGKTLSSLAFALRHAVVHGLTRVVYVVPFTTIIEQNADVFRRALAGADGAEATDFVVEHHSNLDVGQETAMSRLATENWDSPLVVTTSVQFYESLFARKTSRCRKLHNLARSVIVLDEVQTLPVDFLHPCLRALRELATHYGASVVLCTATQPAVHLRQDFPIGLENVREIVPNPQALYESLRRVDVRDLGPLGDEELASRLRTHDRVLCIVNTRRHAIDLFRALGEEPEGHFHLSALMCPEHRTEVLGDIRARLDSRKTCRVVSTQLIEAGVDIDFPVVFRSLAGLDSLAQAAGRCNRNGSLHGRGTTFVFRSQHSLEEAFLRQTANAAEQVLPLYDADPLSLEAVEHYFRLYYWDRSSRWDAKRILDEFQLLRQDRSLPFSFGFAAVAERFRLIDKLGEPVIIPWGDTGRRLVAELRDPRRTPDRGLLRRLQRFTVEARRKEWEANMHGAIELVADRFPVLVDSSCYSEQAGLSLPDPLSSFLNV